MHRHSALLQNLQFFQVQILYNTDQLDIKILFVIVRLEVFTASQPTIDKKGGEIEGYLESFCKWQSDQNPEGWDLRSINPDHWDNGLMLTGINLFDGKPEFDSVIGQFFHTNLYTNSFSMNRADG